MIYTISAFAFSNSQQIISQTKTDDKDIADAVAAKYRALGFRAETKAENDD